MVATLVILFFFTLYVASGLKGGTLLFAHTFGASESSALIITTLVVVGYTFLGGYLAVCWTDLIQGLLMITALVFVSLLGFFAINGSGADIVGANPKAFDFSTGWITAVSLMAWGFGYFGQPHILARFIGIRDAQSVKPARRIGITWMVISLILASAIGLIGIGFNAIHPLEGLTGEGGSSERIFLALTTTLFHPFFAGLVLAAVPRCCDVHSRLTAACSLLLPHRRHSRDRTYERETTGMDQQRRHRRLCPHRLHYRIE